MRTPALLRRLLESGRAPAHGHRAERRPRRVEQPHLVDASTRTFWSRGSVGPATLVESDEPAPARHVTRAATMIAEHEGTPPAGGRPRANPAFSEAVFVELMRARQYRRAYALLTPECQQSWGTLDRFVAAQRIGALAQLRGVRVRAVRFLDAWRDPETGMVHEHAAELDAEYEVGDGAASLTVERTVHLVGHLGQWRSLCYPTP